MFLLVPAYPGCPGSKAVKRSLLLSPHSQKDDKLPTTSRPVQLQAKAKGVQGHGQRFLSLRCLEVGDSP